MTDEKPEKIVYLFGAGATHAELANLEKDPRNEKFLAQRGLLMNHVSTRVMAKVARKKTFLKNIGMVSSTDGSLNIELFISLIENSKVHRWENKTSELKRLVENDIEEVLKPKSHRFYLHKALLELHNQKEVQQKENLLGLISLNYDTILDEAFKEVYKINPDYGFERGKDGSLQLLKLHGSFNWSPVAIRGRKRHVQIIPLGANKSYLHAPYSSIWNSALEILIECDTLRVIGCGLNQNDFHLIDLLFKAHLEKGKPFNIEIISSDRAGENIKEYYGFFPQVRKLTDIKSLLISPGDPPNPFKTWLQYKTKFMLKTIPKGLRFLKKII